MSRGQRNQNKSSRKYIVPPTPDENSAPCSHIERSITPTKVKCNFPHAAFGRCSECSLRDNISLCLKCGSQFCKTHHDKHSGLNNHCLSFKLTSGIVSCSKCSKELPPTCHSAVVKVVHIIEEMLKKHNSEQPTPTQKKEVLIENGRNGEVITETSDHVIEKHIIGLKNTGVVCFFNSVLQNLLQTPLLRACIEQTTQGYSDALHNDSYGVLNIAVPGDEGTGMCSKLNGLFQQIDCADRGKSPLYPYKVFQEMCSYNTCLSDGQQDAQEAYHAIVHSMGSEEARRRKDAVLEKFGVVRATFRDLPREKKKKISDYATSARSGTFINHLFGGTTMNQITCLTCGSITKTMDYFVDLSVPLPKKREKNCAKPKPAQDAGMSKHQKKKQQKDNRKGKKGRDRRSSANAVCETEPNKEEEATIEHENGVNVETLSEDRASLIPESPTTSEAIEMGDILLECDNDQGNGNVDLTSVNMSTADTDDRANHVAEWLDSLVEDTGDMCCDDLIIEGKRIDHADDEDTTDLCEKLDKMVIEGPVTRSAKLRGGYGVTLDRASNDGDIFSGLFDQEDEEEEGPKKNEEEEEVPTYNELDTSGCVGDTLEACIAEFCTEELLDGDNQFSCVNCAKQTVAKNSLNVSCARSTTSSFSGDDEDVSSVSSDRDEEKIKPVLRDAKCRYYLHKMPPILVIHMKRFTANNRGVLQKDRRHVEYPLNLDLDKFVLNSGSGNKYKLFGVVDHSGSLHRGHYIAYVRKRNTDLDSNFRDRTVPLSAQIKLLGQMNSEKSCKETIDKWFCCNDERISEVPVKKVLNADAYLLFYERVLPYS